MPENKKTRSKSVQNMFSQAMWDPQVGSSPTVNTSALHMPGWQQSDPQNWVVFYNKQIQKPRSNLCTTHSFLFLDLLLNLTMLITITTTDGTDILTLAKYV